MNRSGRAMLASVLVAVGTGTAAADDDFLDPAGDASVHRTDEGASGPINPATNLPDLLSLSLRGWAPSSVADPYQGTIVPSPQAHVFRMDLVLAGLVNPPGWLYSTDPNEPFRYGPSPLYGFVELDVDHDRDTGGEVGSEATYRYMANVARFGLIPAGSMGERAARSSADYDPYFDTAPQFERSGEDFSLKLCGCTGLTVISEGGNGNHLFEAGETWIVRGRFFDRAGGYRLASAMFGGTDVGHYDPYVNLRFSHSTATNTTTVSLVFALDMQGAAMLTGEDEQPIDHLIDTVDIHGILNHSSVVEALQDLVEGANDLHGQLFDPTLTLTDRWRNKDPFQMLDVDTWRATAIVGTAYAGPCEAKYVWTDVGFEKPQGDVDGSGIVNLVDRAMVDAYIAATDGTAGDADGEVNGVVVLPHFAANFSPYDVNGDGRIDSNDLAFYTPTCPADWDRDGHTTPTDIAAYIWSWYTDLAGGSLGADFDHNGLVQPADVSTFIQTWFTCLP